MNDPSPYSSAPPSEPSDQERAAALARVRAPALWLIVTGWIGMFLQFALGIAMIVWAEDLEQMSGVPMLRNPTLTIASMIPSIVIPGLMVVGGMKMRALRGYGLAMTGAIVAWIPCTSPCCVLSIPIGIWAFVLLLDADVKRAFR
jgi:hypothetical protein